MGRWSSLSWVLLGNYTEAGEKWFPEILGTARVTRAARPCMAKPRQRHIGSTTHLLRPLLAWFDLKLVLLSRGHLVEQ